MTAHFHRFYGLLFRWAPPPRLLTLERGTRKVRVKCKDKISSNLTFELYITSMKNSLKNNVKICNLLYKICAWIICFQLWIWKSMDITGIWQMWYKIKVPQCRSACPLRVLIPVISLITFDQYIGATEPKKLISIVEFLLV